MAKRKPLQEFAIIGLGRFGSSLARKLTDLGHNVLGIDEDFIIVQSIADVIAQAVALDATNESALEAADIASFDTVVVAIGEDFENNLLITSTLKSLGVRHVICKTNTDQQRSILLRIGADQVIQPEQDSGARLAMELSIPTMLEHVPMGPNHSIAEIKLPKRYESQSLSQCKMREKYEVTVLIIRRDDALIVSPPPNAILQKGDKLVVLGANDHIAAVSDFN